MRDVIVVGARVAGSSTAMLLARKGYDVLVVDRASFPSDTLSTHQVQVPGSARLRRWGLLDRVTASGAPAARQVRFDTGGVVLDGRFPSFEGVLGQELGGRVVSSTLDLADVLLEQAKVAIVPGEAFAAPGYARLSYALGDDELEEGLERIAKLLAG